MYKNVILRSNSENSEEVMKNEIMQTLEKPMTDVLISIHGESDISLKCVKIHFGDEKFSHILDCWLKNVSNYFSVYEYDREFLDYLEDSLNYLASYEICLNFRRVHMPMNEYLMILFKSCENLLGFRMNFQKITESNAYFSVSEFKKPEIIELLSQFSHNS